MSTPSVTVVIPTLRAGPLLEDCIWSVMRQTRSDFRIVVVDNSGQRLVRQMKDLPPSVELIENPQNVGYGAAINQAWRATDTPFVAALNDDAVASPEWLQELILPMEKDQRIGMCASQILLAGKGVLDSAGMLLSSDGSSKQRGHGQPPSEFASGQAVLFPSGCAALYRRTMLEELDGFDESFFLYCEETDLGLRATWAGWKCAYAPGAVVEHRYSATAGASSPLKAYYVERNRLFVVIKNFPGTMLWRTPWAALERYFWHGVSIFTGAGAAHGFLQQGNSAWQLVFIVFRAHVSLLKHGPRLLRQRRQIRRFARICAEEFRQITQQHFISPRQVAAQ
ncbi:MAG: glycosyltransferase family 2 protein [Bryobacteraceae bacterium]|nr:glycosyltransferase family 2 protein [Bryobacteraceae bacterium]MDW8379180.1 glycosyltransferase family 2 protein [Bryobacterales bacterium]